MLLFSCSLFWLVNTDSAPDHALCIAIASLGAMYGSSGAFFSELFDVKVRYSGASLGYRALALCTSAVALIITAFYSSPRSTGAVPRTRA